MMKSETANYQQIDEGLAEMDDDCLMTVHSDLTSNALKTLEQLIEAKQGCSIGDSDSEQRLEVHVRTLFGLGEMRRLVGRELAARGILVKVGVSTEKA